MQHNYAIRDSEGADVGGRLVSPVGLRVGDEFTHASERWRVIEWRLPSVRGRFAPHRLVVVHA